MQRKAVVVGGSNGIGLAVSGKLIEKGYHVCILDKIPPGDLPDKRNVTFYPCNLLHFDTGMFEMLAADDAVEVLMITAGFGRVADFEFIHPAEIHNMLTVNAEAGIKIIRFFYHRIKGGIPFFCGMMGSVAGLLSSPMFSVYAASKAAVCRFAESVNVELEAGGCINRILNISPGSVKGTRFDGGKNELSLLDELAEGIVDKLFKSETLFIPDIEIYGPILERYRSDPHGFGLDSCRYKKNSGRVCNGKVVKIGYLSGTFDLFHVGHLNLLRRAKDYCDYLIAGVHPNAAHKGKETFIPFDERKQIVASVRYVDEVVQSCPEDSSAWELYHFDQLFVGSDYKGTERFNRYEAFFKDKNVQIVYLPYTQGTSSTQIRKTILLKTDDIRPHRDIRLESDANVNGYDQEIY